MVFLIEHPWLLFPVLLLGLMLLVEVGLRIRQASSGVDEDHQSLIETARDGLTVLVSFLLGFSLVMAQPNYQQRKQLVIEEANAISTVVSTYSCSNWIILPRNGSGKSWARWSPTRGIVFTEDVAKISDQ